MIETAQETRYLCRHRENGYLAEKQNTATIYLTFTQNARAARLYSTKQKAARAMNFRKWDSDEAQKQLVFEEVIVTTTKEFRGETK